MERNAYYIQDRLEAQSWARHYQQIARERKGRTGRRHGKKACPSTCLNRYASIICSATGASKSHYPVRLMAMLVSGAHVEHIPVHGFETIAPPGLILIQRYKTDEYSTRNAGWETG